MKKRFIALFMVLMLMFQLVPAAVLSEETPAPTEVPYSGIGSNVVPGEDYAKVTFIAYDGSELSVLNVKIGQPIGELPAVPEREGCVAVGWKTEAGEEVTKDTVVKADMKVIASYLGDADGDAALRVLDASVDGDGVLISLAGAIPEGLSLSVTKEEEAPRKRMLFKARGGPDLSDRPLYTYDISLTGEDGTEYQPEDGPVLVTVQGQKFEEALATGRSIRITHVLEDGEEEVDHLSVNGKTVSFEVDHFSKFVFTGVYDLDQAWSSGDLAAGTAAVSLAGTMPRGAEAEAVSARVSVEDAAVLAAAEITLLNAGVEVEPASWGSELEVTMTGEAISRAIAAGSELHVVHIADDGTQTQLDDSLLSFTDNGVTFPAYQFSVYAVVEPGEGGDNARLTVNFWNGSTKVDTMYVKNSDTLAELEMILFDPGIGDAVLEDNDIFLGWTTKQDYTASDDDRAMAKTIDKIREDLEQLSITEGQVINYYAMILKNYTITYLDPDGISLGSHSLYITTDQTDAEYQITMVYTPTDLYHNFEGWLITEETSNKIKSSDPEPDIVPVVVDEQNQTTENRTRYQYETDLVITGDVVFNVYAPAGNWLIFNQNGKGARYIAPQFIKSRESTSKPVPDNEMTRNGYVFGGWYTEVSGQADEHGYTAVVEGTQFTFGGELTDRTELYAKWTPRQRAPYTVVFWTENINRDGYDLIASHTGDGTVGSPIPFTFRNNGDEDYVAVDQEDYHYTGFCLQYGNGVPLDNDGQPITVPNVTAEGDAVLNLYFKRIEYNLKFYLYRSQTTNNWQGTTTTYSYADASRAGKNVWGIASWTNFTGTISSTTLPRTTYGVPSGYATLQQETVDGYTGYYFILSAYYGEDISGKWPTYDQLKGPNNDATKAVSFVMMNGTGLKGNTINDNGYGNGRDTIKGQITVMDDQILGKTNDKNGNFLIVRYYSYNNWTYHIYYETIPGVTYDQTVTKTIGGVTKTYYLDHDVTSRSSNTIAANQNPPAYQGYSVVKQPGSESDEYYDSYGGNAPRQDNITGYTCYLNYYYNREVYPIEYMDGVYIDGKEPYNILDHREDQVLDKSPDIAYGQAIAEEYQNKVPANPPGYEGFVFDGWYKDAACKFPMEWTTMPIGGIRVYARWRQIEYRVFLHPNATLPDGTNDECLNWGSDTVEMTFRVDYDAKISLPNGTRFATGYELVGWFKDKACTKPFSGDTQIRYDASNPSNPANDIFSIPYNKSTDFTDPMDKFGEGATYNKDINRFWVTKRVDLYAKWHKAIVGAAGINVEYDANGGQFGDGTSLFQDPTLYQDRAESVATIAPSTPPKEEETDRDMVFLYWVLQKWDNTQKKYVDVIPHTYAYPGSTYEVLMDNAQVIVYKWVNPDNPNDIYTVSNPQPGNNTPPDGTHTVIKEAKYTVRLRAEYKPPEDPTPTHIWWFPNYPEISTSQNLPDKDNTVYRSATDAAYPVERMLVNQAVYIKTPGETSGNGRTTIVAYPGYTFIGWAKVKTSESGSETNTNNAGEVNVSKEMFLYYHPADRTHPTAYYTTDPAGQHVANFVAADERPDLHDLYAMWVEDKLQVSKTVDGVSAQDRAYLTADYSSLVPDHEYEFVVQKPNDNYYVYNQTTHVGGFTATAIADATRFKVKAGTSIGTAGTAITVPGLVYGTYNFIEVTPSNTEAAALTDNASLTGYTLSASDSTIKAVNIAYTSSTSTATPAVQFVNKYTRDTGTLEVKKENKDRQGNIIGALNGQPYNITIRNSSNQYLQSDKTSFGDEPYKFTVSKQSSQTFSSLPTGAYTVTEVDTDEIVVPYYLYVNHTYTVTVGDASTTPTAGTGTVSKGGTITVKITNNFVPTAAVTVTKIFSGLESGLVPESTFNIKYSYSIDNGQTWSASQELKMEDNGSTAYWQDSQTKTTFNWLITVPKKAQLKLTENGFTVDNYNLVSTAASPRCNPSTITADDQSAPRNRTTVFNVSNYDNDNVIITNTYERSVVPMTLDKVVTGNMGNINERFIFTIGVYKEQTCVTKITNPGIDNGGWKDSVTTTGADPEVDLGQFPIGAWVKITESENAANYDPIKAQVNGGTIQELDRETREFVFQVPAPSEEQTSIPVVFTNAWNITIPTGIALDSAPYLFLMAIALMGVGLMIQRRRKENG